MLACPPRTRSSQPASISEITLSPSPISPGSGSLRFARERQARWWTEARTECSSCNSTVTAPNVSTGSDSPRKHPGHKPTRPCLAAGIAAAGVAATDDRPRQWIGAAAGAYGPEWGWRGMTGSRRLTYRGPVALAGALVSLRNHEGLSVSWEPAPDDHPAQTTGTLIQMMVSTAGGVVVIGRAVRTAVDTFRRRFPDADITVDVHDNPDSVG
jgi:hypothetical protein